MRRFLDIICAMLAIAIIALGADNTLGTSNYNTAKPK